MSSPRERWARINHLFHHALELAPADRRAWLDRVRVDEPDIADELGSLVASHERADDFLEAPAALPTAGDSRAELFRPGHLVGPYRLHGIIGRGGMGVVYLAEDTRLGRTVALKALAPDRLGDATYRERLRREARAAAALQHPGIATVFALEELGGELYIASEYVPGETLRDEMARGPLPLGQATDTVVQLARALDAAHRAGIVHRDLKPENVVRARDGSVKILDFGLARLPRETAPAITRDGSVFGTPAYMSPEQIRGVEIDGRSDLFSLAVIFYELVTGTHPFRHDEPSVTLARILEVTPPRLLPAAISGGAPDLVSAVVARALSKDPDARQESASVFADALEHARSGSDAVSVSRSETPGRDRARWWWRFHQAAVTLAYAILLAPLWQVRALLGVGRGRIVFVAALVAALVACILRWHLWFADDLNPNEWADQQKRSAVWIRAADGVFVSILLVTGLMTINDTSVAGFVLVAGAASVAVSFLVIEPFTTRAAFPEHGSGLR